MQSAIPVPLRRSTPAEATQLANSWTIALLVGLLGLALVVAPTVIGDRFPGDLGDARLNNYLLEHVYLRVTGRIGSFWNAPIFYPFEMATAFSDNHLGDSPVYILLRLLGVSREDAFGPWYAASFLLNFLAALYAMVRLGFSRFASSLGAFLFAFALPVTVQLGHAQLGYRFGVPLAVVALIEARRLGSLRRLALAGFWTTWQFYCSIYIGYFLVLLLAAILVAEVVCDRGRPRIGITTLPRATWRSWIAQPRTDRILFLGVSVVLLLAMVGLMRPYVLASHVYDFGRPWREIVSMVPRPISYLYAPDSRLWAAQGPPFSDLPMRGEHGMFIGAAPILAVLVALSLRLAGRTHFSREAMPFALAWLLLVVCTLYVGGFTLYGLFAFLPGSDAIRAVTRIILVMVLPAGVLLAAAIDAILTARIAPWLRLVAVAALAGLVIFEASWIVHFIVPKSTVRQRLASVAALIPAQIPANPILLLGPFDDAPPDTQQIDAMMYAQSRGWPTINGYSGNDPTGYVRPTDCKEGIYDLGRGLDFFEHGSQHRAMAERVLVVGYPSCDRPPAQWMAAYENAQVMDYRDAGDLAATSCESWQAARLNPARVWSYQQFLLGYIRAAAGAHAAPADKDARRALWSWMDSYCKAHPLDLLPVAARAYVQAHAG